MQETQERQIWFLGQEDPLVEEVITYSNISCPGNPMDRGSWWAVVHGVTKSWRQLSD